MVFFVTGYVFWQQLLSVYRYLFALEVMVALPVVIAVALVARERRAWPQLVGLAAICALCAFDTVYVGTQHAKPATVAASVDMPELPDRAMIVLLDPGPMSFPAAFARPDISFVGADNALIIPGQPSLLGDRVAEAVRSRQSGLYGVASRQEWPNRAEGTMAFYGVECAGEFHVLRSNLSRDAISICPLRHVAK